MQWTDEGIVLGARRHGETSVILELMTAGRGRHLGLVRGGAGTRLRGILQPGNSLRATWRARLDDHLGNYAVESINLRAAGFLNAAHAVHGVTHLAALCRLLAEREPHAGIHDALETILDAARRSRRGRADDRAIRSWRFSPSSVSASISRPAPRPGPPTTSFMSRRGPGAPCRAAAGEAYRDKLMRLPDFLHAEQATASAADITDAFALTGFFLDRHAFSPRGLPLPDARARFISAVLVHNGQPR